MATTLLTNYQNRTKTGEMYQRYRGAVCQYCQARQRYNMQSQALSGLKMQYRSAKTHAEETEQAKASWDEQFWTGTEQGKGLNSILSRYTGLGININPDMRQKDMRQMIKKGGFGPGLYQMSELKKEYDHSLTRTYSKIVDRGLSWGEKIMTNPANWYKSVDSTAEERQKRKDAWTSFRDRPIDNLGFSYGDVESDVSSWGTLKGSQTYKDYIKGKQSREALDYSADTAVSDFIEKITSATETRDRYKAQYGMAKSSMARMQSMYHGQRVRDARAGSQKPGKQKRSSILLGYA